MLFPGAWSQYIIHMIDDQFANQIKYQANITIRSVAERELVKYLAEHPIDLAMISCLRKRADLYFQQEVMNAVDSVWDGACETLTRDILGILYRKAFEHEFPELLNWPGEAT